MISLLKEAEADPQILKRGITYNNPNLKTIQNDIPKTLGLGKTYTVDDLLSRMIIYSDNVSTKLLENFIKVKDLEKTFTDLGINDPYLDVDQSRMVTASTQYTVSAETYASFFRVLFNASYLSRKKRSPFWRKAILKTVSLPVFPRVFRWLVNSDTAKRGRIEK